MADNPNANQGGGSGSANPPGAPDISQLDFTVPSSFEQEIANPPVPDVTPEPDKPEEDKTKKPEDKVEDKKEDKDKPTDDSTKEDDKPKEGEEEEEDSIIVDILSRLGYEIDDDLEFEENEEGIVEVALWAADKRYEQKFELLEQQSPRAHHFFKYLEAGGDPAKYIQVMAPETNYLTIGEVKEDDVATQERLVKDFIRSGGASEEAVDEALTDYKTAGILYKEAKRALATLQEKQRSSQENILKEQEGIQQRQRDERNKFYEELADDVKKKTSFGGLPITEKDKDTFIDFITPKENQPSRYAQVIGGGLTNEQLLAIQLFAFHGFDLSKLIEVKATTKAARSLRERLNGKRSSEDDLKGAQRERQKAPEATPVSSLDLSIPTE